MSTVSPEAFLSIEASLTLRLYSTYSHYMADIFRHMDKAAEAKDWDKLTDLIDQIDLSHVFDLNEDYIKYLSNVALLFGAARVAGMTRDTSAVTLGFASDLVGQVMQSFRDMLVTAGQERIQNSALDYMAFLKEPVNKAEGQYLGRILKFHNVSNQPRVPAGSPEGGEFARAGGAAVAEAPKALPLRLRPIPEAPKSTVEALNPTSVPEGTPEYGKPVQGAVSVLGVHYSRDARAYLTGMHHGTGLKDAADERLNNGDHVDPRLKSRIYFYVDEGHGIVPEAGVGGVKHVVLLRNLYDPQTDHGKLWSQGKGNANASEKAVIDAGYDGYYVRNFANQSGVAVLLGDHTVKVKAMVSKGDMEVADLAASGGLKNPDQGEKKKKKRIVPDYALAVMKDDPAPSVLPFSSFVDNAGRTFFNIASSLHTSRLSAFGFTAEADYLGITQYQIDEVLDGRTCPVCEYMNGKVFDVSDARGFLDMVVRTQDTDELKSLQPWPSQSKAGLQDLKAMSADELVMSGWHVPPFHPRCRGLLAKAEGNAATSPTNAVGAPAEGPYLATAADFNQLGVSLSPARIEKWNELMQSSPAAVIAGLTGQTEQEVVQEAMDAGTDAASSLGLQALTVDSHGTVNIELLRVLTSDSGNLDKVASDLYFRQDRSLFIGSVEPVTDDVAAASSVFRETMADIYGTAEQLGMDSIEAIAGSDMGGYAMAKYGFAPTPDGWSNLKDQLTRILSKSSISDMLSEDELTLLDAILASDDPKDIFALADMPHLGEVLLSGSTYKGYLDMQDPESVARFLTYLSEDVSKAERVTKFNPNHEPAGSEKGGQFAKASGLAAQKAKEPYLYPKAKPALGGKAKDKPADAKPDGPPLNEKSLEKTTATMNAIIAKDKALGPAAEKAMKNIHKLFDGAVLQINVRSHDVIDAILSDGRFKNQFETHTSMGMLDYDVRADAEHKLFGLPMKTAAADRPIYGTLQSPWEPGKAHYEDWSNNYGSVIVRLKPEVKARATFTGDDSLGGHFVPSRVSDPKLASFMMKAEMQPGSDQLNGEIMTNRLASRGAATEVAQLGGSYVEAQIHGGVKASDITDIYIPTHGRATDQWTPAAEKAIKDLGINVHLYKGETYA